MDLQTGVKLLFSIAAEVERSLEMPVIFLTMKDYAMDVFDCLVKLRAALLSAAPSDRILDIVKSFHYGWLQAVNDIEHFKHHAHETPRSYITKAIDFTVASVQNRHTNFSQFIKSFASTLTLKDNQLMQENFDCITDTEKNLVAALNDKYKSLGNAVDQVDYNQKVLDETEELLTWLDILHNNLAIEVSKVVDIYKSLSVNLSDTLQQSINEVAAKPVPQAMDNAKEFQPKRISFIVTETEEANKILNKIKILEDRINELKNENSYAVLALKHKVIYLEQKRQTLENSRISLLKLKSKYEQDTAQNITSIRIFDHLLPPKNRSRLVKDLLKLWTEAICSKLDKKSLISILSKDDSKEQLFSDKFGKFIIDYYGRKLYIDEEGGVFQLDFKNEMVPLEDDSEHIFFYDDYGRYFYNDKMQRIYKLNKEASEYCLQHGLFYLVKETRGSKDYCYDNLGRYYIDEDGKRIYSEDDGKLYENDGFGNLVRIRDLEPMLQLLEEVRPAEPLKLKENLYLQKAVGEELKKSIARVIMAQPADPVLFLASCLEQYGRRLKLERDPVLEKPQAMLQSLPRADASLSSIHETEITFSTDTNFLEYKTAQL